MIYVLMNVNLENTWLTGMVGTVTSQILIEQNMVIKYISSTFRFLPCGVKLQLLNTYCMPLYGSILWDLGVKEMSRILNTLT